MNEESVARQVASRLLNTRGIIREAILEQIGDSFDCIRCWSAWSVGTMTDNDYYSCQRQDRRDCGRYYEEVRRVAMKPVSPVALDPEDRWGVYQK
jgi:hypothetical protein